MAEKTDFMRKKAESNKSVSMSIGVSVDVRNQLQQRASESGMSLASFCREIFEIYLENEEGILLVADKKAKITPIEE